MVRVYSILDDGTEQPIPFWEMCSVFEHPTLDLWLNTKKDQATFLSNIAVCADWIVLNGFQTFLAHHACTDLSWALSANIMLEYLKKRNVFVRFTITYKSVGRRDVCLPSTS